MRNVMIAGLGAAGALIATAGAAEAQDWRGFYVGGFAGYSMPSEDEDETILFDRNLDGVFGDTVVTAAIPPVNAFSPGFCDGRPNGNNAGAGCSADDPDGAELGFRLGHDWQSGQWVVGLVGDLGLVKGEDAVTGFSTTPARYSFEREINTLAAARVRVGYQVGRYLPYVTTGLARARVNSDYTTSNVANSFSPLKSNENADGYQLGLGVETLVRERLSVGVEYLYSNLDSSDTHTVRTGPGSAPATNPFLLANPAGTDQRRSSDEIELNAFRVTMALRF